MRVVLRLAAAAIVAALGSGCANFAAIKTFASDTSQMTGTLKREFQQVDALCRASVDVQQLMKDARKIKLDQKDVDESRAACKEVDGAVVELQKVTVATLDLYAAALLALVDDRNFDLKAPIEATSRKLAALKDADGTPIVNQKKLGALTSLLSFLGDAVVQAKREEGVRKMLEATPSLLGTAEILKEFLGNQYLRWVAIPAANFGSSIRLLERPDTAAGEPLRAAQLIADWRRAKATLDERASSTSPGRYAAGRVQTQLVSTLEAWMALVPEFRKDALTRDPAVLLKKIDSFRARAIETRDAVEEAF